MHRLLIAVLTIVSTFPKNCIDGFSPRAEKAEIKVKYRSGQPSDEPVISWALAKNFRNPFRVSANSNYLVAVDGNNDNTVAGWVQIRPLGSVQRDPKRYNARPGSYDVQEDVDDQMWEEFENEQSIVIPNGLSSLPWTKEYRDLESKISGRQARRAELVEQAEREQRRKSFGVQKIWEMSTLYVDPSFRGHGIGSELVRRLCNEYKENGKKLSNLYLATNMPAFYGRLGCFEKLTSNADIPSKMIQSTGNLTFMRGIDNNDSPKP